MTRSARAGALLRRAPMAGAVTLGLLTVLALVDQAPVVLRQCVAGDGVPGRLGLHLALLRAGGGCPDGTFAVGGDSRHVIGVVVVVALPALLVHAAGLLIGVGAAARLRRALSSAVVMLTDRVRPVTDVAVGPVRRTPARVPVRGETWSVVAARVVAAQHRRGPPALRFA